MSAYKSRLDQARNQLNEALQKLTEVQTFSKDQFQEAKEAVEQARKRLYNESKAFKEEMDRRMMDTRSRSSMPRGPGIREVTEKFHGVPGLPPLFDTTSIPTHYEEVWACRECGTQNVNWKSFKSRKRIRSYAKAHDMNPRKIKGGIRICLKCTQRMGRDIIMERIPLKEVLEIKMDYEEKKASRT